METGKLVTLTHMSKDKLENVCNYDCNNLLYLHKILEEYFDGVCNFGGNEYAKSNAYELVRNSDKIRALVYTMGDIISNISDCLDFVVNDMYSPEELKVELERVFEEMESEREKVNEYIKELNSRLADEKKSREETVSAD